MPTERRYTLAELASIGGVTPRTVRYYVSQGLLRAPGEQGRGPHYDDAHLERLRLIRELQKRHQPLAEIRRRLESMTDDEVGRALSGSTEPGSPQAVDPDAARRGSALEYVRSILGGGLGEGVGEGTHSDADAAGPRTTFAMPAPKSGEAPRQLGALRSVFLGRAALGPQMTPTETPPPDRLADATEADAIEAPDRTEVVPTQPAEPSEAWPTEPTDPTEPTEAPEMPDRLSLAGMPSIGRAEPGPPPSARTAPTPRPAARPAPDPETPASESTRSQWDRIALTPDIELHVRRPLSRFDNRRVERLITIARQVLKEGQP